MITDKQFNILAQKAHFVAGLAAVWGAAVLIPQLGQMPMRDGARAGLCALIVFAMIKEFWYDYKYETPEVRGSSLEDFAFYALGAIVAYAACVARALL